MRELDRKYVWPKLSVEEIAAKMAEVFEKHDKSRLREVDGLIAQWGGHELGLLQFFQDKYRSIKDDMSWRAAALERHAAIVSERKRHDGRRPFERVILMRVTEVPEPVPPPPPPKGTILISRTECDALFLDIDKDGDGQLTKEEIKAGIAAIKSSTGLAQSAKKIWKAADADASNSVDADEFFAFMQVLMMHSCLHWHFMLTILIIDRRLTVVHSLLQDAMAKIGKKRELTPEEKAAEQAENEAAAAVEAISRVECDELFVAIDIDGDGQLTKQEIKKGLDTIKVC